MGTKLNPGKYDCYANALPDEPMFVLLARDPDMPDLVREWAKLRLFAIKKGERPKSDQALVNEARECATDAQTWRYQNDGKWRAPQPPASPPQEGGMREALIDQERVRLAKMLNDMAMAYPPGSERMAVAIAARAVGRGRQLTAFEQMNNLKSAMAEWEAAAALAHDGRKGTGEC